MEKDTDTTLSQCGSHLDQIASRIAEHLCRDMKLWTAAEFVNSLLKSRQIYLLGDGLQRGPLAGERPARYFVSLTHRYRTLI